MENLKSPAAVAEGEAASPQETSFGDILSQFEQHDAGESSQRGALEGTVVSISADFVFVDIGRKVDGVIPAEQFREPSGELSIRVGDHVLVTVTGRDAEGSYTLSTIRVERPKDWSGLEAAFAEGRIIAGTVTEVVKGGLRVDVGMPAFMPASRSGARQQGDMEKLVGQEIQCKIIKLDTAAEDVVVDRRAILEQEAAQAKAQAFSQLKEGETMRGTVRNLADFGAFVELAPGVEGLLHVGDIAWHRVAKPSDALSVGDSIEVKILKINPETRKISVGQKQLMPDPWTVAADRFQVGERVQGKVSRLTDFGAFVELMPGVDGLIHVSEMSWSKKIRKPGDVVKVGDLVDAVVLAVNVAEHRISLGLKQALGDPWVEAQKKYKVGGAAEGKVSSLQPFGAFIDLGDGIEGMIHVSDITSEKRLNHPSEALKLGQEVRAAVTEVDGDRRRIKLSIKQLEPTSVDQFIAEHKPGEVVSGRIISLLNEMAKVELDEGVVAECRVPRPQAAAEPAAAAPSTGKADLSSLTAMLSAKWKQGGSSSTPTPSEGPRVGEIASFRIVTLDDSSKKIELALSR